MVCYVSAQLSTGVAASICSCPSTTLPPLAGSPPPCRRHHLVWPCVFTLPLLFYIWVSIHQWRQSPHHHHLTASFKRFYIYYHKLNGLKWGGGGDSVAFDSSSERWRAWIIIFIVVLFVAGCWHLFTWPMRCGVFWPVFLYFGLNLSQLECFVFVSLRIGAN